MKIRKAFQGTIPDNKILDTYSTSQTDTYSCNFINKRLSVATATSTTDRSVGVGWITLDSLDTNDSSKFTLNTSDVRGGIVIGPGVSKVLISSNLFVYNGSGADKYVWTEIRKNYTAVSISIVSIPRTTGYSSVPHTPLLVDVQQGDVIAVYKTGENVSTTFRSGANCWLTVQVVE